MVRSPYDPCVVSQEEQREKVLQEAEQVRMEGMMSKPNKTYSYGCLPVVSDYHWLFLWHFTLLVQ